MSTDKGFKGWGSATQCQYCGLAPHETDSNACPASGTSHSYGPYGPPGDEKLLRYLYEHKHMTPFEMAGFTIEVQAPIFVFREWHRHRTQSYNELSARYTPIPDVNYMPSFERCNPPTTGNKQAQALVVPSTGETATEEQIAASHAEWLNMVADCYDTCEAIYKNGLLRGIPKEVARVVVPVGRYSRMRASTDLRNWLGFLTLRMDPAAQWEIRQYANAVGEMVSELFPRTWALFNEGRS